MSMRHTKRSLAYFIYILQSVVIFLFTAPTTSTYTIYNIYPLATTLYKWWCAPTKAFIQHYTNWTHTDVWYNRIMRATRRFNALYQKANVQLINIFQRLLTDKQHTNKNPKANKNEIAPREVEETDRDTMRQSHIQKWNEMAKKKIARVKNWPNWASSSSKRTQKNGISLNSM